MLMRAVIRTALRLATRFTTPTVSSLILKYGSCGFDCLVWMAYLSVGAQFSCWRGSHHFVKLCVPIFLAIQLKHMCRFHKKAIKISPLPLAAPSRLPVVRPSTHHT